MHIPTYLKEIKVEVLSSYNYVRQSSQYVKYEVRFQVSHSNVFQIEFPFYVLLVSCEKCYDYVYQEHYIEQELKHPRLWIDCSWHFIAGSVNIKEPSGLQITHWLRDSQIRILDEVVILARVLKLVKGNC